MCSDRNHLTVNAVVNNQEIFQTYAAAHSINDRIK
jgi:hypothetical protein